VKRTPPLRAVLLLVYAAGTLVFGVWLLASASRLPGDGSGGIYLPEGHLVGRPAPWATSLQRGDLVVQINALNVREGLATPGHWYRALFGRPMAGATYTVIRDGQPITVDVSWNRPTLGRLVYWSLVEIVLALVFVASGVVIVWQRGEDLGARLAALALISEGLNLVTNIIPAVGANVAFAYYWFGFWVDLLSLCLTISALFHCVLVFPQRKWLGRRFPRLSYLVHPLTFVLSVVLGYAWHGQTGLGTDIAALELRGHLFSAAYILVAIEFVVGVGHMVHTYMTTQKTGVRNQIRWVIWGLAAGVVPWLLFSSIPYAITGKPILPFPVVMPFLGLIPIALTLSIVRYGLMSIDTVINRSLVYAILTVGLIALNYGVVGLFANVLKGVGGIDFEALVIGLSTLVSVIIFSAVRGSLQRLIDRIFYRGRLNFEQILREMGERLATTLVFDNLATLLTEYIPMRLRIARAILLTRDPAQGVFDVRPHGAVSLRERGAVVDWLQREERPLVLSQIRDAPEDLERELAMLRGGDVEICLPLRRGKTLIGIYALGKKMSGDLYDDKELDTLILLSHQIASAMENARLYDEVEAYSRTLESQVEERTKELRATNKKLADMAWDLTEQRARLDAILQNIADGLVVTDLHGKIELTNTVFEQIVDMGGRVLQQMSLQKVFADPSLMDVIHKALEAPGSPQSGEVVDANGRIYKAAATAWQQGGAVAGATTVLRDITHEVEVDRMKTDFISTVSHELRTPLTSILGFAKLILRSFQRDVEDKIPEEDRRGQRARERIVRNLGIIESESHRLTRLIGNLLDISKMDAGKIEWNMAETHIQEAIESAVTSISALATEKQLPVRIEAEPALPTVTVDKDRLIQVVTNLLANAIKFTDKGEIVVRAWPLEAGEDIPAQGTRDPGAIVGLPAAVPLLVVSVTDTGSGIQPEDLPQVFERFQQVGDPLGRRTSGTGLGLPICREIIEYHGGHIWVESTPDVGSRFVFTLPLTRVTKPPEGIRREIRRRVSEVLPGGPGQERTILVVDDEPNIRALLHQELADAGYRVIQASDGLSAVEAARQRAPDLIVLDVMMPGLTGFDVTSVLKSDERTQHIPIVILSIIEDREKGFRLGADAYLTKPIDAEALLGAIASLLRESVESRRVLVVDPDVGAVQEISGLLQERGFAVVTAYDSHGAIREAEQTHPDLVIVDAGISQEDNNDLLKALKYQAETQDLNIIVLVGGLEQHIQ
jgi:PAS domain S-box-containing protein